MGNQAPSAKMTGHHPGSYERKPIPPLTAFRGGQIGHSLDYQVNGSEEIR
jgi:hypothetical protein